MTKKKARASRPVDGLVLPPSSYEEYLLLSEKDKLRLMKQEQAKRPNDSAEGRVPASAPAPGSQSHSQEYTNHKEIK